MDNNPPVQRKTYRKPEISRVDLVEDEVALASCKAPTRSQITSRDLNGNFKCKLICLNVTRT